MTELAVSVKELVKEYRVRGERVAAVDGVSFNVRRGGSLAIVGESGSGKTTTVRCLMGLEPSTAGEIRVEGRKRGQRRPSASERRQRSREIQMVFQDPYGSMNPRFTVRKTLRQALILAGHRRAREEVQALLELVELPSALADSYPRTLSGGQRQRVAIARALASDASILVLDEALSALDVSIQAQILNLLTDLRESRNITLVSISHDMSAVRQIADDVVVMRQGKVVEAGSTGDVLDRPTSEYTRQLLDAVPRAGWSPERARRANT